jgi:hypothetical protein
MRGEPSLAAHILTRTRMQEGIWEAVLSPVDGAPVKPRLRVTHLEQPLDGVELTPHPEGEGQWCLRIAVPAHILSDGVQTVLIDDADSGARLGSFTIVTGEPLEDDIRAELGLLRAELDMLKRSFRQYAAEAAKK